MFYRIFKIRVLFLSKTSTILFFFLILLQSSFFLIPFQVKLTIIDIELLSMLNQTVVSCFRSFHTILRNTCFLRLSLKNHYFALNSGFCVLGLRNNKSAIGLRNDKIHFLSSKKYLVFSINMSDSTFG